jgi:hypothetical protein
MCKRSVTFCLLLTWRSFPLDQMCDLPTSSLDSCPTLKELLILGHEFNLQEAGIRM